jgi:hypothetical protein
MIQTANQHLSTQRMGPWPAVWLQQICSFSPFSHASGMLLHFAVCRCA